MWRHLSRGHLGKKCHCPVCRITNAVADSHRKERPAPNCDPELLHPNYYLPLYQVNSDFGGPYTNGLWGHQYVLVAGCPTSNKAWFRGLCHKSDFPDALSSILGEIEKEKIASSDVVCSIWVTDNEHSNFSASIADTLRKSCIKHRGSTIYSPATNGYAERLVRSCKEFLRANLAPVHKDYYFLWPALLYSLEALWNDTPKAMPRMRKLTGILHWTPNNACRHRRKTALTRQILGTLTVEKNEVFESDEEDPDDNEVPEDAEAAGILKSRGPLLCFCGYVNHPLKDVKFPAPRARVGLYGGPAPDAKHHYVLVKEEGRWRLLTRPDVRVLTPLRFPDAPGILDEGTGSDGLQALVQRLWETSRDPLAVDDAHDLPFLEVPEGMFTFRAAQMYCS
jgi:hypothetical protein